MDANRFLRTALTGAVVASLSGLGLPGTALGQEEEKHKEKQQEEFEPAARAEAAGLMETIEATASLSAFARLLEASGMKAELENRGQNETFTILAPSNEAFDGVDDKMLRGPDRAREVVLQHIVRGEYTLRDLREEGDLTTLNRLEELRALKVDVEGDEFRIGDARIVEGDIQANNGVIHVIDKILFPTDEPLKEP